MEQRDAFLKEFRGETLGSVSPETSFDEYFQNEILRPILKLQNDLLIISFINYTNKNKIDFIPFLSKKNCSSSKIPFKKILNLEML